MTAPGLVANSGPLQAFIGTRMTASLVSGPASGSLQVLPSGAFTYTPAPTFVGVDSFVVQAQRDCSGSMLTSAKAVIHVNGAWMHGVLQAAAGCRCWAAMSSCLKACHVRPAEPPTERQGCFVCNMHAPLLPPLYLPVVKPPLGTPAVNRLAIRISKCSAAGVNVDAFNITAGSMEVAQRKGPTLLKGIPTGFRMQVALVGAALWPLARDACFISRPGKINAAEDRAWDKFPCPTCLECLISLKFKCGAPTPLQVCIQAVAAKRAMWVDSDWSAPLTFTPICKATASNCF